MNTPGAPLIKIDTNNYKEIDSNTTIPRYGLLRVYYPFRGIRQCLRTRIDKL